MLKLWRSRAHMMHFAFGTRMADWLAKCCPAWAEVYYRELMRISMRIPEMVLFKKHHLHWIKLKKLILLPCHWHLNIFITRLGFSWKLSQLFKKCSSFSVIFFPFWFYYSQTRRITKYQTLPLSSSAVIILSRKQQAIIWVEQSLAFIQQFIPKTWRKISKITNVIRSTGRCLFFYFLGLNILSRSSSNTSQTPLNLIHTKITWEQMKPKLKINHCEGEGEVSFESFFGPEIAAVAAAVTAAAAAPSFTPPAAFITLATFANIATPPTSTALKATVGFTAISYGNCKTHLCEKIKRLSHP